MGKKDRTFAAKLAKSALKESLKQHCPVCGEAYNYIKLVASGKSKTETWKFKEKFIGVCKCNQQEIYS